MIDSPEMIVLSCSEEEYIIIKEFLNIIYNKLDIDIIFREFDTEKKADGTITKKCEVFKP